MSDFVIAPGGQIDGFTIQERALLGSVSSRVASEALCSVTVVRPRASAPAISEQDRDMPQVF